MKSIFTVILICLPILIFGQKHKIYIIKQNGEIHEDHYYKSKKLKKHTLFEATADSIYTLNHNYEILSYSINDIKDPRLSIDDLVTYTRIYTVTGDFVIGKLNAQDDEVVKVEVGKQTIFTIKKENILEQYNQYINPNEDITYRIKTVDNQTITGKVNSIDDTAYYLQSKLKTTQIPFSDITSKQRVYKIIRPYSVGISLAFDSYPNIFPYLDFEVNLWRNNRFAVGINSQLFGSAITAGPYVGINLYPNTMIKVELSPLILELSYQEATLAGEANLRHNFGSKRQFYGEVGAFTIFGDIYFRVGIGYRF